MSMSDEMQDDVIVVLDRVNGVLRVDVDYRLTVEIPREIIEENNASAEDIARLVKERADVDWQDYDRIIKAKVGNVIEDITP